MKLAIEKKDLINHIMHLASIIPGKITSPILTNYLIQVDADSGLMQITASDLEITVIAQFPALVQESGVTAVSARHLNEIINSMPDQMVYINKVDDNLKIQCNKIDFNLLCADHTLFPIIPSRDLSNAYLTSAEEFHRMIAKTAFAVSNDTNRAVLTGICWQITPDWHLMAATDGRKVAEIKVPHSPWLNRNAHAVDNDGELSVSLGNDSVEKILPVKTVNFLQKVYDSDVKELKIVIENNGFMFAYADYTVFSHIIEHKYPDYQKAFIHDLPNSVLIDKEALKTAIKRVSLMSPADNMRIRFDIDADRFEISTFNREEGEAKQVLESFSYDGTSANISINHRFVLSILDAVDTDKVKLKLGSAKEPLMIYNEQQPESQEITFLLMPLRS
ncbi:MAG: DNA polymerase III subunit beta [Candidatus Cloacimonetes bacterium]|nr:DNA polymerase III subunit beta [Candidatus Cloacimonadota bacterium]